jgi:hypothetical protein
MLLIGELPAKFVGFIDDAPNEKSAIARATEEISGAAKRARPANRAQTKLMQDFDA